MSAILLIIITKYIYQRCITATRYKYNIITLVRPIPLAYAVARGPRPTYIFYTLAPPSGGLQRLRRLTVSQSATEHGAPLVNMVNGKYIGRPGDSIG